MNPPEESQALDHQRDYKLVIGVLAVLEGHLRRGLIDDEMIHALTQRIVAADLLASDSVGVSPSVGYISIAIANLNHRLRYYLGEYDSVPQQLPFATMFVMQFPSEAQAAQCKDALPGGALDLFHEEHGGAWIINVVYPDVPPDATFRIREKALATIAKEFGGQFKGTQDPPLT